MKILLVEHQTMLRQALSMLFATAEDEGAPTEVIEAPTAAEGLALLHRSREFNAVLLDYVMPDAAGGPMIADFVEAASPGPVFVLGASQNRSEARIALESGAAGYICKSVSLTCLRELVRLPPPSGPFFLLARPTGQAPRQQAEPEREMRLTERQRQIVRLVAAGSTNKQIARVLGMEATTVKSHLRLILRKLRVRNRTQLAVLWRQFDPEEASLPGSEERLPPPPHQGRDASA